MKIHKSWTRNIFFSLPLAAIHLIQPTRAGEEEEEEELKEGRRVDAKPSERRASCAASRKGLELSKWEYIKFNLHSSFFPTLCSAAQQQQSTASSAQAFSLFYIEERSIMRLPHHHHFILSSLHNHFPTLQFNIIIQLERERASCVLERERSESIAQVSSQLDCFFLLFFGTTTATLTADYTERIVIYLMMMNGKWIFQHWTRAAARQLVNQPEDALHEAREKHEFSFSVLHIVQHSAILHLFFSFTFFFGSCLSRVVRHSLSPAVE